jgi:hypothetical protein
VTVGSVDPGAPGAFRDAFDRPDSSSLGSAWKVAQGRAGVQARRLATAAVAGSHMAVLPGLRGSTQQASVQFWSPSNNAAPRFGIVLRYQDARNYYVLYRVAGGTSALRISRVVGGKETVLKRVAIKNPARNVPFRLNASASGNVLAVDVDGAARLTVTDAAFGAGTVGVWLVQNAAVSLPADDFAASVH